MNQPAHSMRTHLLIALFFVALCSGFTRASAANVSVTVLDKDSRPVPGAVVIVLAGGKPATLANTLPHQAKVYQERMRFVPAISIVALGAKVQFVNNDAWEHHVRGSAAGSTNFNAGSGEGFELRLDGKPADKKPHSAEVVFTKAGAVLLGCHIHASMSGHVYVSDSPWAALTNAEGVAVVEQLPEGAVHIKVWHPDQLGDIPPQSLTLGATPAKATLHLSVVPRRRRS
ncbi:MAG: plastocyanin [Pseudomonadota bacterium]